MNRLKGTILRVESAGNVSLVEVAVAGDTFSSMLLETPQSCDYLREGREVFLLFKDTEVSLARELSGRLSIRNRAMGRVVKITRGAVLSRIELDYRGNRIASLIASRSAQTLDLHEGDEVIWLIKSNEVSLAAV